MQPPAIVPEAAAAKAVTKPPRPPAQEAARNEYFDEFHPPADRDLAADGRHSAGRRGRLSAAARGAAAAGRLPDDPGHGAASRRQPGNDGVVGDGAAGAAVRADPRRVADDVVE